METNQNFFTIDELAKWKCSHCQQTFDARDVGQLRAWNDTRQAFSQPWKICQACEHLPEVQQELQEFFDEEGAEVAHDERQWRAYRNEWPILSDPSEQAASNEQHSQFD